MDNDTLAPILFILTIIFIIAFLIKRSSCNDKDYRISQLESTNKSLENDNQKIHNTVKELAENNTFYQNTISKLQDEISKLQGEISKLQGEISKKNKTIQTFSSNLTAFPYMAGLVADMATVDLERMARSLDWGYDQRRLKKVEDIRKIRKIATEEIEKAKIAEYQLAYLLELYPPLHDVIEAEFHELEISLDKITDYDPVRNYISKEEWDKLTPSARNQLALDRYVASRRKSKWQIGRDYELYVGYLYEKQGYTVNYFGSNMGLEDLGRDLIIQRDGRTVIIQCKYWSADKQIHEKHIMQLFGTVTAYNIEHNTNATGILFTSATLSTTAKKFAKVLGITCVENKAIGNFPRIKCNIGAEGLIYHLPMDMQYDKVKLDKKGECMAMTVAEAEELGFRRAYRWHGSAEA